jgi:hypothetical protein
MKHTYGSRDSFNVAQAAEAMRCSVERVETLISKGLLGFTPGLKGPVISAYDMNSFYLGRKPVSVPEYKKEKPKRKRPKYYVKAKTKR